MSTSDCHSNGKRFYFATIIGEGSDFLISGLGLLTRINFSSLFVIADYEIVDLIRFIGEIPDFRYKGVGLS